MRHKGEMGEEAEDGQASSMEMEVLGEMRGELSVQIMEKGRGTAGRVTATSDLGTHLQRIPTGREHVFWSFADWEGV